ncbi:MAG: hypothetical protein HQ541_08365, partial [Mariniphaga sp.]|nr:hypothetical protein [Mariniphaga sp.]
MTLYKKIILLFTVTLLIYSCTNQNNWNQYLGADRNASVTGENIIKTWPENGPSELWSQPLGPGYGGASIFEDEVYILDRVQGEADILRCFDLNTGEEHWNYRYEAKGEIPFPGSRIVPYVDKNYIWSVGPHG